MALPAQRAAVPFLFCMSSPFQVRSSHLFAGHLLGVHGVPAAAQLGHSGHVHNAVVQVRVQPGHEAPQEGRVHVHRVAGQPRLPGLYVLRHKAQDLHTRARQRVCIDSKCPGSDISWVTERHCTAGKRHSSNNQASTVNLCVIAHVIVCSERACRLTNIKYCYPLAGHLQPFSCGWPLHSRCSQ